MSEYARQEDVTECPFPSRFQHVPILPVSRKLPKTRKAENNDSLIAT